ncbi:MAG: DUF1194 domain-containing protein [Paracoccaceae bacterium]
MTRLARFALRRLVALAVLISAQPASAVDWLVLVVDRSNSISRDQLSLQRQAYARVLRDASIVEILRDAGVAIVEFDSEAEVIVPWTTAEDAASRYENWNSSRLRGGTAIGAGLSAAMDLLAGKDGARVIDISGDGRDNRNPVLLDAALARATGSGVEVNGLVLREDDRNDIAAYYRQRVVNGFVIMIERWEDFENSLKRKIGLEARLSQARPASGRDFSTVTN